MFNIVLVEPQIPPNTGNIGRLCVATNSILHLIKPLGFSLDESSLKRAGLDYWDKLIFYEWESLEHFLFANPITNRHFFFTTKSNKPYFYETFKLRDYLYFGREDAGLPKELLEKYKEQTLKIPQTNNVRSINLATAVGAVLYEAVRQNFNEIDFLFSSL